MTPQAVNRRKAEAKFSSGSFLWLAVGLSVVMLHAACHPDISSPAARRKRVETGLLREMAIKGAPEEPFILEDRMAYFRIPGCSIAIINNDRIEWARGYGYKENGREEPVTSETLFQAASISKPVAATAALHFVEAGDFDLDGNVNATLQSWRLPDNMFTAKSPVCLRSLLCHRAGITVHSFRGYAADEELPTLQQVLNGESPANSAPVRVDIEPGSQYRYSGGGYTILQQMLIDQSQETFPDIMWETVLKPAGMLLSTYHQPLPVTMRPQAAIGHRDDGQPIAGRWHAYPEMAAAGLWTTPTDLARFVLELIKAHRGENHGILSADMVGEMWTIQSSTGDPGREGFGLGFMISGRDDSFKISHGGSNEGFRCQLIAYPETGQGAIVMTNGDNGGYLLGEVIRSISAEYDWPDYKPQNIDTTAVESSEFDRFVGAYRINEALILNIFREENRFYAEPIQVRPIGEQRVRIYPRSKTEFFDLEGAANIRFESESEGGTSALVLEQNGRSLRGIKLE